MSIWKNIVQGIEKKIDNDKLRGQGKAIFLSGKDLKDNEDPIIKEGYLNEQRRKHEKETEIERMKQSLEKIKLEQQLNAEKLKNEKIKADMRKEQNKNNGGW